MIYIDLNNNLIRYEKLKHIDLKKILHLIDDAVNNIIPQHISILGIKDILNSKHNGGKLNEIDELNIIKLIVLSSFDYAFEYDIKCECGNEINILNYIEPIINTDGKCKYTFGDKIVDVYDKLEEVDFIKAKQTISEIKKYLNNRTIKVKHKYTRIKCRICGKEHNLAHNLDNIVDIINHLISSQYSVKYLYEVEFWLKNNGFSLNEINEMYVMEHSVYKVLLRKQHERSKRNK